MVMLPLLVAAALATPQSGQSELPFFTQGTALLEQADERRDEPLVAKGEEQLLERVAPLHHIVRVGVIELWVPRVQIDKRGAAESSLDLAEVRPYAALLIDLQRLWLTQTGLRSDELARHEAALETIGEWAARLSGDELPELDEAMRKATRTLEHWFQPGVPEAGVKVPERDFELVMILAPTRAHYFALLGASGLVIDVRRDTYWHPAARRSVSQWLTAECLAVAMSLGPNSEYDPPLANDPMDRNELSQQVIHAASHLLSNRVMFEAPSWFREGLAIHDTVALAEDDDTLCSGYSESHTAAYTIPALANLLPFLERDLSLYRDGPARKFFPSLLRPDKDGGFAIHDIDLGKRAFTLPGPFLGKGQRLPDIVFDGSRGVQRGFAEFMRAYGAAFVEFLSQQRMADRSVLAWSIEFVRQRHGSLGSEDLLPTALRMITQKTLGESADPERDLEAAYKVWLESRK